MNVLCPKAFKQYIIQESPQMEGGFLQEFFSSKDEHKAVLANEVWESFRFVLLESNYEKYSSIVTTFRGFVEPEMTNRDTNFKEILPTKKYDVKVQIQKTKDFLERNYVDIDYFFTPNPEEYQDVKNIDKIKIISAEQFYLLRMADNEGRAMIERHALRIIYSKYE